MRFYCYIGGVLFMAIVGIVVQCYLRPKKEDEEEHEPLYRAPERI